MLVVGVAVERGADGRGARLAAPWPSQTLTSLTVGAGTGARLAHGARRGTCGSGPAPSQRAVEPAARDGADLAQAPDGSGTPVGTKVQIPGALGTLQVLHVSVQRAVAADAVDAEAALAVAVAAAGLAVGLARAAVAAAQAPSIPPRSSGRRCRRRSRRRSPWRSTPAPAAQHRRQTEERNPHAGAAHPAACQLTEPLADEMH